jgi:hypothetical protein
VRKVWIVLPATREVVVIEPGADARYAAGETLAASGELPGLAPAVAQFFSQISCD